MKKIISLLVGASGIIFAHALVINEIMSNPVGDDSGREWVEIYNDGAEPADISALSVSIKGGTAVVATPVSGGTVLASGGYAIIGSTISGSTKFLLDYPTFAGPLLKSSISLVNTGITSVEIKLNGVTADTLASYTAAKEGSTLSRISGAFVTGIPTPGAENQSIGGGSDTDTTPNATSTGTQVTVSRQSPPTADIVLYLPFEKTVVAGAETEFSVYAQTRDGRSIDNLTSTWAFGDGGQAAGTSTIYRYAYPGHYIAQVEATTGYVAGTGIMKVRAVPPDIVISKIDTGRYGPYVDIENPNPYDLDLSQWRLSLDGALFPFPKNTIVAGNTATRFSGLAMGFASTSINASTTAQILFPNLEVVTRYAFPSGEVLGTSTPQIERVPSVAIKVLPKKILTPQIVVATSTAVHAPQTIKTSKDTRLIAFFKSLFGK